MIPGLRHSAIRVAARAPLAAAVAAALLFAAPGRAQAPAPGRVERLYDVLYEVRLSPTERTAHVRIEIGSGSRWLRSLRFSIEPGRHLAFQGDGRVETGSEYVTWTPPREGGSIRYVFLIDHLRDQRSYDARCASTWALFRGDDLVPPVRARFAKNARSRSRLRLRLPEGWSAALPYPRLRGGDYRIDHPHRAFDRPTGWMVYGDLGVVREEVAGSQVAVAGPVRHGLRRIDILALLRWTLPELNDILGEPPERLLVVGAGDPMWRGGLSGPNSVFLHADRPLIGEDGTSPILHELVHAVMGARASDEHDWIVEGLAEYYSLELLVRSGTLSSERHAEAIERIVGVKAQDETASVASRDTARGVGFFRDLDAAIRARRDDQRSLDDVLRELARQREEVDLDHLKMAVGEATGLAFDSLGVSPPTSVVAGSGSRAAAR